MKISKKQSIVSGTILAIIITSFVLVPIFFRRKADDSWEGEQALEGSALKFEISKEIQTAFGRYSPQNLSFNPQIIPTLIQSNLNNVDKQGLTISNNIKSTLLNYGFAIVNEGYENIYDIYIGDEKPKYISTDLCLHAYHVLYDISLRLLEVNHFYDDFEIMLNNIRDDQISLKDDITEQTIDDAIMKNIAYLSVMLSLLNETNEIPIEVLDLTNLELDKINSGIPNISPIFEYEEDYSQYKVRGHYTRNDLLGNYFKAMMYAGRMGFLLQSPENEISMGINHTQMALLLISSFNKTIGDETIWDYWDRLYEPTAFYVGACDDLTPKEYEQIWQEYNCPVGDQLANETLITEIINHAKNYRKPQINSMFINEAFEAENVTHGFRLMGQRFIPDSYIFQQLVHDKVPNRLFPNGLDVFSVFGSPRASYHMESDEQSYSNYKEQIENLRTQFGNLTEYDWTQNLYWSWLYSLFPLLYPASSGYPGYMRSNEWCDKALMTALGSWSELRHDTILYAKQSYSLAGGIPDLVEGYVEPYPELYSRLRSLVLLMRNGLYKRGLISDDFLIKLDQMAIIFEKLTEISIKELETEKLSNEDFEFIKNAGLNLNIIASYETFENESIIGEADERMAIIADVHTDPNSMQVLEVATGNPYTIYVVVQDYKGNLRLCCGEIYSYFEFLQPISNRLSDEQWHEILDSDPPEHPGWITSSLPIV